MKKLLLAVLVLVLFAGSSYAQEFKPFKVGLGLGYAAPAGEGSGGGILLYAEPMYRISDEIAVGLRLETALVAKASLNEDGTFGDDLRVSGLGSYTLSGQYYFSNGGFRPFAGAGMGLYRVATASLDGAGESAGAGTSNEFGFYPRVGFDAGHFNMQLEYNLISSSVLENVGTSSEEIKIPNSYFAIKVGFSISGGRR